MSQAHCQIATQCRLRRAGKGGPRHRFSAKTQKSTFSDDRQHVAKDHVHLMVSIPPQVTISRLLQWLKGKTAHHLLAEFPHLKKQFWGRHLWARGYFCCSSGNVTDEVIAKYIAEQNIDQDEDFRVDG
jgi:REP element-mobilizing transposase RayT